MASEAGPSRAPADPADDDPVAVIAAAGAGRRFGSSVPKQYVQLEGASLLERSVRAMLGVERVRGVVVALAPGDERFGALTVAADPRVRAVTGAPTRAGSVAAALAHVRDAHGARTWTLVHDAARPLVAAEDVARLLERVRAARDGVGGILAARVADTLKRERAGSGADGGARVDATVPRAGLWGAQTPQLFRAGALHDALVAALDASPDEVTDEASAMERAGTGCLLVEARRPNPKITRPADLAVARALLRAGAGLDATADSGRRGCA